MLLLLLSRGGSSRLFNHGDRIICIHCFKWFEITIPFRKCVSGVEQLICEKSLPHGLEPTTLSVDHRSKHSAPTDCATTGTRLIKKTPKQILVFQLLDYNMKLLMF